LATGDGNPISMAVALYKCMGLISPSSAAYALQHQAEGHIKRPTGHTVVAMTSWHHCRVA
jgi:hypothetical protein